MHRLFVAFLSSLACFSHAAENVMIVGVPDYSWYAGCFGTAGGNLMGYWDRNGFPNFYTGPTSGGNAPLHSAAGNKGIRSMWASKAGFDGRPANQPGHLDDYWTYFDNDSSYSYESTEPDPYIVAGRPEHEPDCIGDFIGASQNKWNDFDGECSGNIDAYSFNFWDKKGLLRMNFVPPKLDDATVRDVQSGLREWTRYRGYQANVGSQLVDFNPEVSVGHGFTFEDLKAEILRGYPVMLILQNPGEFSRNLPGMSRGNPNIHAMLAYKFVVTDNGDQLVQFRTSWASGEANESWAPWGAQTWAAGLDLRGVVVFHPLPQITHIDRNAQGQITIRWDGPNTLLHDAVNGIDVPAHLYQLQRATSMNGEFSNVGDPTTMREVTVETGQSEPEFFRVKLLTPAYDGISHD